MTINSFQSRRLLLGLVIGLGLAGLLWVLVNSNPGNQGITLADLGGALRLLIAGALIGLTWAGICPPTTSKADQLLGGALLGLITWTVLALNLYPLVQGAGPMWQIDAVAPFFPQLVAYLLIGALTGLAYSWLYHWLAQLLGLAEPPAVIPEIKTRIVVLGGGYAGVSAAQALDDEFKHDGSVGVWLVSETNFLLHTPMLSEVAGSAVDAQNITPPLRSFFRNVQVVQGAATRIDLANQQVHLAGDSRSPARTLPFDHLVLTLGGIPNFFGNQGIAANSFTLKSLEDAILLRNHIIDMFERADVEPDALARQRMLTFVVAGGGFAGVELMGGLNDFARGIAPFYPNIDPAEVRLVLVHSGDRILPELSEALGKYAQEKLAERGVEFKLQTRCTDAEPHAVILGGETLPTETFVWTAGNRPAPVLETLGVPLNKRGQLPVDRTLAAPNVPGLWAAGDCAEIPDPHSKTGFAPPTAQHALREGKVLGHNIAAAIRGETRKEFEFKALGSLSALGHQLAVAEVFGYRFSGFLAWLMWRAIYLSKLPNMEKRVRVGLNWLIDIFFPPDIVQTINFRQPAPSQSDD